MRGTAAVLFGLILACPLFWWPGTGFDAIRLPALLGLVAAFLALHFVRAARGGERPPGPAPLRTAGLILLAIHLLSLAAARSIPDAAVPLLVLFAGVSVFACLRGGILRRESVAALLPVISGMALVFAAIGIGQRLRLQEAVSTEGNRNYAGALAAMLLPVTVAFTRTGRPWQRLLAAFAAADLLALLLLTQSRGGGVAAAAGLLVAAVAMRVKRVPWGGTAAAVALLLIVGLAALFQANQVSPERMKTAGFRLDVWKSGLRMLGARPLLGWGAGGFSTEYPRFRSESEFKTSHEYPPEGFKELEDAHSSWVQVAAETGLPGLLAFLLVVYVAARLWRYGVKVAPGTDNGAILGGLGGGAAAYLVAGLFNTLTLKTSHTVLFWSFLGLIELVGELRPWRQAARSREWKVAVPAAAAFTAFFGALWAGSLGMADAAFTEGMITNKSQEREARLRESLDANPYSWRAHYELSLTLSMMERFQGAVEEGRATLRLRPYHLDALNHTAICLIRSGGEGREAESLFRRALDVAPFYYKSLHNFGQFERQRGNGPGARELFTRSIEHKPEYAPSYFCRGLLAYSGGDAAMAIEDFRKARALGLDVAAALRAERSPAENDSRFAELFK
jgi:O-antigen ligase